MVWLGSAQMQARLQPLLLKATEMTPSFKSAERTAKTLQSVTRQMITRPLGPP
jgi:hypothetical protein